MIDKPEDITVPEMFLTSEEDIQALKTVTTTAPTMVTIKVTTPDGVSEVIKVDVKAPPPQPEPEPPPVQEPVTWARITWPGNNWANAVPPQFRFCGQNYHPESADKAYCIQRATNTDAELMRFEVRNGDLWPSSVGGNNSERAEGDGYRELFPKGTVLWCGYSIMFEPGEKQFDTTGRRQDWGIFGQYHGSSVVPAYLKILTEGTKGQANASERLIFAVQRPGEHRLWTDPAQLVRGKVYNIVFNIVMSGQSSNFCKLWVDGRQVADYSGAIGTTAMTNSYWKFGIYRGYENRGYPPIAVQYANMKHGRTSLQDRVTNPPAWPSVK